MKPLRVGIIGCGLAGTMHAAAIQKLSSRICLTATCDRLPQKAEALARQYGVVLHSSDCASLLDREILDAVSLCLPHRLHAEVAIRAAGAGLHVLVEKPLSTTLEEADRMIEAARRQGVLLMVAEPVRYQRLYRKVIELLQQDTIGRPFLFRLSREHHMHRYFEDKPWFLEDPSGGIMYSGGIHDFDILRMLAGEVEHVYALETCKALEAMSADDTSVALVGLASGAVGTIIESFSIKTAQRGVQGIIHGTGGTLRFAGTDISLYTAEEDGHPELVEQIAVEEIDGFAAEIEDFVECIQNNREPVSTAMEGRKSLACVVAAYQSMKSGKRVYLTDERGRAPFG
jgi:predicted dehydrogenase